MLPKILLVDMNSFFASVEQQANPAFRDKPLGVCASLHNTSCLIAASKEAKALGIKTGTLVYKAKKICPEIILVQAEPAKYREVNQRLTAILRDYTDKIEVYSIDEAFLDLNSSSPGTGEVTRLDSPRKPFLEARRGWGRVKANNLPPLTPPILGGEQLRPNPLLIAAEIKKRIKTEIGEWLTCSIGIAENKFMAKLAADLEKPDGLTVIWREYLPEIYKTKKLSDLWGIGHGWTKRLEKIGITNPLQLLNYPVQNLVSLFGKPGFYIWQRVNGLEIDEIASDYFSPLTGEDDLQGQMRVVYDDPSPAPPMAGHPLPQGERENLKTTLPKSFGHSWVLNFRTIDKEKLKIVILRLAEKAARRMRAENFRAYGFYLSVTLLDGSRFHRSKKLKFTIDSGLQLFEQALLIWKTWQFKQPAMHIAVGFTNLTIRSRQLSLFSDSVLAVTDCLDQINNKYGEFTIRSGLLAQTQDYAPDAIAFGR